MHTSESWSSSCEGGVNEAVNGAVSRLVAERANRRLPAAGLRHGDAADRPVRGLRDAATCRTVRRMRSWTWPVWRRLPALTTLQAVGVIVAGIGVSAFLPVVHVWRGFGLDIGGIQMAAGFALAMFSAKRPSRRESRRRAEAGARKD